jgi:flavin reductase (DIM6/NTAB) family NADH-FMN oxidoreductase RutF
LWAESIEQIIQLEGKPVADFHFYEPGKEHGLAHDPFNAIIAPRPIGWISTRSADGVRNLAPYSFFNAFNYFPPIIGFASIGAKDSLRNARETGEFVWNLATRELAELMNLSSSMVAPTVDEFALAGIETASSRLVAPARVAASPVSMECKVTQIVQLETAAGALCESWVVFGEVVGVHIDRAMLEAGVYITERARPILRGGGAADYFEVLAAGKFAMFRPEDSEISKITK